ncbi:hypothetical protein FVF58_47045 [Paraburkholderia panacisoli]|uniref:Uncharacterized protein n=1 Tax=Paraburkholderia panacisoli TaxID=2603818 RepID=A0A5B0G762_9BURK|nr:hypothetical protein [Paraburkholderia panacisoli]KAA0997880.1 hypothetical protein FVF58_47045 [Paraburkholderia panacisoli]
MSIQIVGSEPVDIEMRSLQTDANVSISINSEHDPSTLEIRRLHAWPLAHDLDFELGEEWRAVTIHLLVDSASGFAFVRGACSLLLHLPDIRAIRLAPLDPQSTVVFRDYVLANLRNGAWPALRRAD